MDQLPGIFFHMDSGDPDALALTVYLDIQITIGNYRKVIWEV